ncbi:MAG: winged helix-turn-helix domain-containing protein [Candidatus Micrarchaeota archaeon]
MSGRKEEIRAFAAFVNAASNGQAGLLLLVGGPGCGKTAIIRLFQAEAEKAGMLAPSVKAEKGEDEKDLAGKAYQEMALSPEFRREGKSPGNFRELAEAAEKAGRKKFGAVIFIDDIDQMRNEDKAIASLQGALKAGWGKRKVAFVVSSTSEITVQSEIMREVALGPFAELEAREMIEHALKKGPPKMGEECLQSILADSGGNPRLLKTVCYSIYERLRENEKVISKGHYLAYLPQIMSSLSRDWFGRLYRDIPQGERAILRILTKDEEGMHVSDIAKKAGKPLGPITALTKRLLDRGQIVRIGRGKYRIFSKLYMRYVSQRE